MKEATNEFTVSKAGWSREERLLLKALGAAAFALLTILGAYIRIPLPFTPVPMTLQTFVVPLAGGFLGAAWGAGSMLLYLVLGLAGLNVFAAASGGFAFFLAPTAGYLVGFVAAAAVVGWVRDHNKSSLLLFFALLLSHVLIFTCGIAGLMLNANMGWHEAFLKGVSPFLIGDALKIIVSYLILISFNRWIHK